MKENNSDFYKQNKPRRAPDRALASVLLYFLSDYEQRGCTTLPCLIFDSQIVYRHGTVKGLNANETLYFEAVGRLSAFSYCNAALSDTSVSERNSCAGRPLIVTEPSAVTTTEYVSVIGR